MCFLGTASGSLEIVGTTSEEFLTDARMEKL